MIVECPACHTHYRTNSAGVIDGVTFFECSHEQCRHVFLYSAPALRGGEDEHPAANHPPSSPSRAGPGRSFSHEGPPYMLSSRAARLGARPLLEPLDEQEDSPPPSTRAPLLQNRFPNLPSYEAEDSAIPETPFFIPEENDDEQDTPSWNRFESRSEVTFSPRSILVLLGFIILGYAVLGFYLISHPGVTAAMLSRLPLLDVEPGNDPTSAQEITLTDLKGSFWLTRDNRRVFAVSGKAVNNAPQSARSVQIEGTMYDAQGKVAGQETVFCGTQTAAATLESLTVREIAILQGLAPPAQFNIPAGQVGNFLIVFTTPPPNAAEFSCRVAAVQFGSP